MSPTLGRTIHVHDVSHGLDYAAVVTEVPDHIVLVVGQPCIRVRVFGHGPEDDFSMWLPVEEKKEYGGYYWFWPPRV